MPGDMVTFLVSRGTPGGPTAAPPRNNKTTEPIPDSSASPEGPSKAADSIDEIGPFKVLSLGNRLGSVEVMKSARIPQLQENVMTICVTPNNKTKALQLRSRLEATNFRQVGVLLQSRSEK
jgi:hypothetical protein